MKNPTKLSLPQLWLKLLEHTKYYTYALLDPRKPGKFSYGFGEFIFDYEPFYIGKGCEERIVRHDEKCSYNRFKANLISKIKRSGFSDCIRIRIKEDLTAVSACDLEVDLISLIGRRDLKLGPLTNLTDGGEGRTGTKLTKKARRQLREKKQDSWRNRSKEDTDSFKRKKSEYQKEARSKETKEKAALRVARQKLTLATKTLSQRKEEKIKRQLSRASWTEEFKISRNKKISDALFKSHSKKTLSQKEASAQKQSITKLSRNPEDKAKISKRMSDSAKEKFKNETPEQKEKRRRTLSEAGKLSWAKKRESLLLLVKRLVVEFPYLKRAL